MPAEARMRALRAREDHVRCGRLRGGRRRQAHLEALVSHELDADPPMGSSLPVPPEERSRTDNERMQEHTHLARLLGGTTIPLTLLTQRARAATANARGIHHT